MLIKIELTKEIPIQANVGFESFRSSDYKSSQDSPNFGIISHQTSFKQQFKEEPWSSIQVPFE
ncbi:hypothetical protein ACEPPN_013642 [Leptodophora sp. 'Broadleaf-Isolate-01']